MTNDKAAAAHVHIDTPSCWCDPILIAVPDDEDIHEIWVHRADDPQAPVA